MQSIRRRWPRLLAALFLVASAGVIHGRVAIRRSQGLLEHDESISLMVAAGKSHLAQRLYAERTSIHVASAGEIQFFMRYTDSTGFKDVLRSLAAFDIHPPFYFFMLHAAERLGVSSQAVLRMFGFLIAVVAAWIAHRFIWPDAPPVAKFIGAAWLLLSPICIDVATQLRQYSLVYLGTLLSIAGLLRLGIESKRPVRTACLIAAGPLVLLGSHFGTVVWIGLLAVIGANMTWRMPTRRPLWWAVVSTLLISSPLLYWWWKYAGAIGTSPRVPFVRIWPDLLRPMADGLGHAWISWPGRWKDAGLGPPLGLLIVIVALIVTWLRKSPMDRRLAWAMGLWTLAWLVLLARGRMPPHAVAAKYLAPVILGTLVLMVRATGDVSAMRVRLVAYGLLVVSMMSHGIGINQAWQRSVSAPLMAALSRCHCLMVNVPKRGFFLPLVAAMRPDARVMVADTDVALQRWSEVETLLPPDSVVTAEILQTQESSSRELAARLERKYENVTRLRDEPARTVTWYRRPTTPQMTR
ncbi:MAG: hypothetical protein AABZ08_04250 [Planctomycetota bacterium]